MLRLVKDFESDTPKIRGDFDQLQQVFLNLLLNARDAMTDGSGEIKLKSEFCAQTNEIVVEVSDEGTGITSENAKLIFDPFFSTKPTGHGTGLGLAVCYGIVTAHGGKIEAHSNNGKGSRFVVSLPLENK